MTEEAKPVIGITMGDPAGIGPEIVLKSVVDPELRNVCEPLVIGDLEFLRDEARRFGLPVSLEAFDRKDPSFPQTSVAVRNLPNIFDASITLGIESPDAGKASAEYIMEGVELWNAGIIDAICTAPINKASLNLGGYDFPGHTEFLADLTNTRDFRMSFMSGDLRVLLLSTHLSLKEAIGKVKKDAMIELIRFADRELSKLLGREVTLAVAGLNPHASEGGLFGDEEQNEIQPAVEACQMVHEIDVKGPFSPDTVFLRAYRGEFDGVIACYHDQATIAVKSLSFGRGVNVTLGLPLIRTSVDHGTAYDLAGKGEADHHSMLAAIACAADFVKIGKNSSSAEAG
ncbi:MAG: 4-hydroxythreonine-4-phosphate dehydrogenase PdxA [Acidobacteria bacterium]|nr:MAG: 4-hydroxythreonine-4-phosphate dehydrogenase PdxA [Acidobacteriota bacterium]REK02297.1 MAG: 4-hydroxythreonine-4-phosphate dehydrogenase PdxA [Acidobacteriota bacterium]REK13900.1 MAG: 4-hydroxythreonine-4-phosphate dehydrogenase PdxA [Acidobacteriota bacterium]REK41894.1 MAG: 4-hydroxythreonine-4-phosphate dehydrogenase PdxA [Acidobacteriota bacterium]